MKVKTLRVKVFTSPRGEVIIRLQGEKKYLDLFQPAPDSLSGILSLQRPALPDSRLDLPKIIKTLIPQGIIKEVFIRKQKGNRLIGEIVTAKQRLTILPSAGVFLAMLFNSPIYFEESLGKEDRGRFMVA
ncbi:MAG TPA: hypothetical protein ENG66_00060 [Thermococcus sp.]|nr:hypothetical protein [Thermococcus sp.]